MGQEDTSHYKAILILQKDSGIGMAVVFNGSFAFTFARKLCWQYKTFIYQKNHEKSWEEANLSSLLFSAD